MTIGTMARLTGLSMTALRYYERNSLIRVARDSHGNRDYDDADVEWIKFIRRLKETGMPIREIQKYSALRYCGERTMSQRLEMLRQHRIYVLEQNRRWQEYLQNLDEKILFYESQIERGEQV